jgi:hypothetical protein
VGSESFLVGVAILISGERPVQINIEIAFPGGKRFLVCDDKFDRLGQLGRVIKYGFNPVSATGLVAMDTADDGD